MKQEKPIARLEAPEFIRGSSHLPTNDINYSAGNILDQLKKQDAEIAAQGLGLVQFPVADGYAQYIVRSLSPLKLQHVNAGDAWQVSYATIRGLRRADVEAQWERAKAWKRLFKKD